MTRVSSQLSDPRGPGTNPPISLEIFPPRTVAATNDLLSELARLDRLDPAFVSVTYGAGGTTRTRTDSLVCGLSALKEYPVVPHLTAIGHTHADIKAIVDSYVLSGVENLMILRGDPPVDGSDLQGDFRYATDLVTEVRGQGDFDVGVAAFPETHPHSSSRRMDRIHLADKLDKADFAVTQFFFDAAHYRQLVAELAAVGCTKPIIPGIMPVTNTESVARFAAMNGTTIPQELFAHLDEASAEDRLAIAVDHCVHLVDELIADGVPGLHFYTLNKADAVKSVVAALDLD